MDLHLGCAPVLSRNRHVGEGENLLDGVPERPLGEREPGRELLHTRALFDEVVDCTRLRVTSRHCCPLCDGGGRDDANTTPHRSLGTVSQMAPAHDAVVFVPAWNEEANLPTVLAELASVLHEADVLVIDDGSTDATAEVARERSSS